MKILRRQTDPHRDQTPTTVEVSPWRRVLPRRRLAPATLAALVLLCFPARPVWEWSWRSGPAVWLNCTREEDDRGVKREVWRWVQGREIWVYAENPSAATSLDDVASGVFAAVRDAGPNLKVHVMAEPPPYFHEALLAALVQRKGETCFDFWRYAATLARVRTGRHADVVIMDHWFASPDWAHGMAVFNLGLAVLTDNYGDSHTAKHETIHMLGYHIHDDFPVWIIGYPDEPWWCFLTGRPRHEGLMQLLGSEDALRLRTQAALREFWRALDRRARPG